MARRVRPLLRSGSFRYPAVMRRRPLLFALALALTAVSACPAFALPSGWRESTYVRGFSAPTAMAWSPDERLFVAEQGGKLRVVKNGKLLSQSFLTVTTDSRGERGLLGVAFHPKYSDNGFLYVYYTVPGSQPHNRVSRFSVDPNNPDVAQYGSEKVLLDLNSLSGATNHNGGALQFGRDGKLYIGVGDNANGANSQTKKNLLGKVLRMNDDGSVPADNPFVTSATGKNRLIYALGLRNPFTLATDLTSGAIRVNDVGQGTWEEVNRGKRGANYGWPTCEGRCSDSRYLNPVYQYARSGGGAITGGVFYRSTRFSSSYEGNYFFSDYLQGFIRRIDGAGRVTTWHGNANSPVDLDVGPDANIYYLSLYTGRVYRISRN